MTPDVNEALRRMDPYDVDMRNKRLKRAADLGVKHTYLPYDLQAANDPWADASAFRTPPACALNARPAQRRQKMTPEADFAPPLVLVLCSDPDADRGEEGAARAPGDRWPGPHHGLPGLLLEVSGEVSERFGG